VTWIGPSSAEAVRVPDLVGLTVPAARKVAWDAGVVIAAEDPDGPPLSSLTWPGVWVVTAQQPASGSVLRRRGSVVVDFRKRPGEETGNREPRRPLPPFDVLTGERDLAEDPGRPGERWRSPH
jgi:hypothetical protein